MARAKLTADAHQGLTPYDIANFIYDEVDSRMQDQVLAQTPHGSYTFIVTDIICLDDGSILLKVKDQKLVS